MMGKQQMTEELPRRALERAPAVGAARPAASRYDAMRRLLPYLLPYRTRWIGMVCVAVLSTVATIVIPLLTKAVIDGPIRRHDQTGLWLWGSAALGLGAAEVLLWIVRRWLVARSTMGVEADIRKDLYARMQLLPMSFHSKWQSGQLLSRIMNDLGSVRRFLSFGALFLLLNSVQILATTLILLVLYWPLGVIVLVSILPITVTVLRNERQFTLLSRQAQDQSGRVATQVEESALGLRAIKSFGREDYVFERFDTQARSLYDIQLGKVRLQAQFWTILEVIPNVTLIIVLGLGATAVGQGRITIGTLVAFITMMLSIVWPIASMGFFLSMTQESMTAADRIVEVFDVPREIEDGAAPVPTGAGALELRDVGYRFPDSEAWALRHLDLTVPAGQTLAIVGATGSGKSVLVGLISRLYDVSEGQVSIDGTDVKELQLRDLRSMVATAFEDPTLFSMSVRENLTLGRAEATDEQVEAALQVVRADFVRELPYGLETRIGEQGMSLSGGQRQRLALARAVLAGPQVLVLDDTLSALDVHTEALVEEALREVLVGVTAIVVAHRASTVLLADRVALMEDGAITHLGSHRELLRDVPAYRYLLAADESLAVAPAGGAR